LVGLEERFILPRHARELPGAALHELSALNFMDLTSAAPLDSVRVTVRAALAEGVVAARLELAPGAPILVREHVFVGVQGNPVLCGDAIYRGDRYQFTYSLGAIDGTVHSAVAYLPPEDLPPEQSHARSDHH
jgi:DNA-binding GntR family transcriptional regulator